MARSVVAIPLAGLIPNNPAVTPGLGLALTSEQQQRLATALRQAPSPALVVRALREALHRGEPLARILERLRNPHQAAVLRPYAIQAPPRDPLAPRRISVPAARPTHRPTEPSAG